MGVLRADRALCRAGRAQQGVHRGGALTRSFGRADRDAPLLPNALPPLIVVGTVQVAHAIALEATLSFLGLGLPPTEPSLGLLIANGYEVLMSGKYWISMYPGIALLLTILAINLVGDQLRDILNPRLASNADDFAAVRAQPAHRVRLATACCLQWPTCRSTSRAKCSDWSASRGRENRCGFFRSWA